MTYCEEFAQLLLDCEKAAYKVNDLNNRLDLTYGIIVDVEDPEQRGRVRVILDEMNPEYIQEEYKYEQAGKPTETTWVEPCVPFKGIQPKALLNARVPIFPRAADPNRLWFGDPVWDKYGKEVLKREDNQPRNSAMTRLPIYPSGELPPPGPDNFGCMVIEDGGPAKSDWLCVCLKRRGKWYWVRHVDVNHIHGGQDDGSQGPDSKLHGQKPVKESVVWDLVSPTTGNAYSKQSKNRGDSGYFGGAS